MCLCKLVTKDDGDAFALYTEMYAFTYSAKGKSVRQIDRKMQGVPFIYILTRHTDSCLNYHTDSYTER